MSVVNWDLDDGRVVQINYQIDTNFDINEIVRIDINNLLGEYLTAPVLFNTVANLRTLASERLSSIRMTQKICEKKTILNLRRKYKQSQIKVTIEEISAELELTEEVIQLNIEVIEAEKNFNMMENLYWSVKEKCNKLDNLFHKISPEEFNKDIMEGQVNNILIKVKKSLIK